VIRVSKVDGVWCVVFTSTDTHRPVVWRRGTWTRAIASAHRVANRQARQQADRDEETARMRLLTRTT